MKGLTGNEVARCLSSVQICQKWWDENSNGSAYGKKEKAALNALNKKLSAMLDDAFPPDEDGNIDDSTSDDLLLTPVR